VSAAEGGFGSCRAGLSFEEKEKYGYFRLRLSESTTVQPWLGLGEDMKLLASLVMIAAVALASQTAGAVVIGQIDTFQSGTTEGWVAGLAFGAVPPVPPTVIGTGGPAGVGDAYLQVTAVGESGMRFDPGSRLSVINATQWAGDYLTAGVGGIAMDLRNLGDTDLTIRLLLEDRLGRTPPANEAVTSFGLLLPAHADWTHVVFPISASDLTALLGDATTLLSQVTMLRIIHSPNPDVAVPVVGVLGADNITAIAVPEPSSLALTMSAVFAALVAYRRRRNGPREERF
jgi:hypothetical protein